MSRLLDWFSGVVCGAGFLFLWMIHEYGENDMLSLGIFAGTVVAVVFYVSIREWVGWQSWYANTRRIGRILVDLFWIGLFVGFMVFWGIESTGLSMLIFAVIVGPVILYIILRERKDKQNHGRNRFGGPSNAV